jgi:CrcB protein
MTWIAIALGGALGSMARHGVSHLSQTSWMATRFPVGIAIVNLAGCLVVGLLAGLVAAERIRLTLHGREFVFVGLLGGFTTFSTFGLDTFLLVTTRFGWLAFWNVVLQVGGGLLLVWLGYQLGTTGR